VALTRAQQRRLDRAARAAKGIRVKAEHMLFKVHSADKTDASLVPFGDLSVSEKDEANGRNNRRSRDSGRGKPTAKR